MKTTPREFIKTQISAIRPAVQNVNAQKVLNGMEFYLEAPSITVLDLLAVSMDGLTLNRQHCQPSDVAGINYTQSLFSYFHLIALGGLMNDEEGLSDEEEVRARLVVEADKLKR